MHANGSIYIKSQKSVDMIYKCTQYKQQDGYIYKITCIIYCFIIECSGKFIIFNTFFSTNGC